MQCDFHSVADWSGANSHHAIPPPIPAAIALGPDVLMYGQGPCFSSGARLRSRAEEKKEKTTREKAQV